MSKERDDGIGEHTSANSIRVTEFSCCFVILASSEEHS
jgi:hypothetical protein